MNFLPRGPRTRHSSVFFLLSRCLLTSLLQFLLAARTASRGSILVLLPTSFVYILPLADLHQSRALPTIFERMLPELSASSFNFSL